MKRIEMFETQDGERFDSAEDAAAHEANLDDMAAVEAYLAKLTWERGQETRARGILQGFVAYQRAAVMARLDQIAAPTQDQIAATGGPAPDRTAPAGVGGGTDTDATAGAF
jgi:hypothetical protein